MVIKKFELWFSFTYKKVDLMNSKKENLLV